MSSNASAWSGFDKKTVGVVGPRPGKTLAYMLPTQTQDVGDYGPFIRFEYNLFVFDPASQQHTKFVQSEICGLNDPPTTNDKLVQRLADVNQIPAYEAVANLGNLAREGFLILNLVKPSGENFLRIGGSEPVPSSYEIPLDVQTSEPAEKPQRESYSAGTLNKTDEPPF